MSYRCVHDDGIWNDRRIRVTVEVTDTVSGDGLTIGYEAKYNHHRNNAYKETLDSITSSVLVDFDLKHDR